jgi:hypothetical protein
MDSRFLFALCVIFVVTFVRWRVPALPRPIATFGSVLGIGLLVRAAFPSYDWRWVAAFIQILVIVATALGWVLARGVKPVAACTQKVDQSVTSQGQSGGITARNVNISDV